jgi:hypothetical protein
MTFVFPILLGGLALIGIPVLIHLIMRQKPRRLPFPAFRFLQQRHRKNLRKLRLRHLLLLGLRILILAGICLALARPRAVSQSLGMGGDRPMAAVLVFDTSFSMEYTITGGRSRLDEAKKRGREVVEELPEGSLIAVLDTAENISGGKGDWLSPAVARERINGLTLRPGSASVTARLESAYRLLNDLARSPDEPGAKLPRLLCVFSDRTRACWDAGQLPRLYEASDPIPSPLERLRGARDDLGAEAVLLQELRQRLPPPSGQDYPEQALIDDLHQLRDKLPSLQEDGYPDRDLNKLLAGIRTRSRELIRQLQARTDVSGEAQEYRERVLASLGAGLQRLRGVQELFIDVGVNSPTDLAIVDLELPPDSSGQPRQIFAANEKIVLRALVQATGQDYNPTVICQVAGKTFQKVVSVKAGERQPAVFEIDPASLKLSPGPHQVEVRLATPDLMPFDNVRYATFVLREPRRVLVLVDEARRAELFTKALEAVGQFSFDVRSPGEVTPADLSRFQAVILLGLRRPDAKLWGLVNEYLRKGGGVGVFPGGEEMDLAGYNGAPAQAVLPGQYAANPISQKEPGVPWDLSKRATFQHPLMKPFRYWQLGRVDFIEYPRYATLYWDIRPNAEHTTVVVTYADDKHRPAILERQGEGQGGRRGRLLLFTTPMDIRRDPPWNNYDDKLVSFYLVLTHLTTSYLAGDAEPVQLNFLSGQAPAVVLPLTQRFTTYNLIGPGGADSVPAAEGQNTLSLPRAVMPGNYRLEGADGKLTAAFSVNLSPEECNLTRVPPEEIEALFGPGAVAPVDRRGNLRDALQGHWSQPVELFPVLMIVLLLVLAVENLLANKFYRREPA